MKLIHLYKNKTGRYGVVVKNEYYFRLKNDAGESNLTEKYNEAAKNKLSNMFPSLVWVYSNTFYLYDDSDDAAIQLHIENPIQLRN
jgi:hypothetical protein